MAHQFSCECGAVQTDQRLPDCEVCPQCGTKVGTPGEDLTPIEHHWCVREEGKEECKRCRKPK